MVRCLLSVVGSWCLLLVADCSCLLLNVAARCPSLLFVGCCFVFAVCSLLVVCCLSVVVCRWRLRLAFEVGVCWLFFAGEIDGWCCAFVRYCVLFVSVRWRCLFRVACGR